MVDFNRIYDGNKWTNAAWKPRVSNGQTWIDVVPEKTVKPKKKRDPLSFFRRRSSLSGNNKDATPVAPVDDGDGKILVTIPSFRDGEQCGKVLMDLFQNAQYPENIVVSVVEQHHEDDTFCVEAFCKAAGNVEVIHRAKYQGGGSKMISNEEERKKCPRIDQIRQMRIQDNVAKGPPWARALGRRSLGNEEFCLQTSTYVTFVKNWDVRIGKEWLSANNEFAVLSNRLQTSGHKDRSVPRTCGVDFLENERLPYYAPDPEGAAEHLEKPLLAHTWSPGFSFSKCHLEEAAPADGFLPYVSSDVEAFARYARMWTRGYDVYTPTRNIVFSRFTTANPHKDDWIENWRGLKSLFLENSYKRIRSYLEISEKDDESITEKIDNLGVYGLGKRRTLKQLNKFVGIDLATQQGRAPSAPCGNFEWIPYDSEISPMENLYSNPDDLDPQPEFPMRTKLTFVNNDVVEFDGGPSLSSSLAGTDTSPLDSSHVPYGTLFVLWVIGLTIWYNTLSLSSPNRTKRKRKKKKDK